MRISNVPGWAAIAGLICLLPVSSAEAFRCGSNLIKDGMDEYEVTRLCGEPASRRIVGYTLRYPDLRSRGVQAGGLSSQRRIPQQRWAEEVAITELIYDFGPRKLVRKLRFEGSVLVSIEKLGYGSRR